MLWTVVTIGAALFLFQQFAGINAVVYYSTAVFRSAGITSDVAASALVGTANVLGNKCILFNLSSRWQVLDWEKTAKNRKNLRNEKN